MLDEIESFVRVVEAGSFTAAARKLGVPKSTLSRALTRLEDATRVRLLRRSTRSIALTDAGKRFFEQVAPHVGGLQDAMSVLADEEEQPHGRLRLTMPGDLGEALVADLLARFVARYPRIHVETECSTRLVNLAEEGFDAAIRASVKLKDSSLVARKLGQSEVMLFASPQYLARRGTPRSTDELTRHDVVLHTTVLGRDDLGLRAGEVRVAPRLVSSDFGFLRSALRGGAGIGVLPSFLALGDVAEGRLVRVLPEWVRPAGLLWFVYPSSKHVPKKVVALRDFLLEAFAQIPALSLRDATPRPAR